MYREMKIFGFTIDTLAQRPVVILKDLSDGNTVPIWMNGNEAMAIVAELMSRDAARHSGRKDLLANLMERLELKVAMVAIEGMSDGRFSASVRLSGDVREIRLDVRLTEALVTALTHNLPVMVAETVVEQASSHAMADENVSQESDARRFADYLERLDPSNLGKYPM